jgi:tRNA(Met) C34 N-acetyltransferase TmcA
MANTTKQNDTQIKDAKKKLAALLAEAKELKNEVDQTSKDSNKVLDNIEKDVDVTINGLEKDFADLDKKEKQAGDELDKLIIDQADDLTSNE